MATDVFILRKAGIDWRLEKKGSNRALVKAPTKEDAVHKSRSIVRKYEGLLVIHKKSGKVQAVHSYASRKLTKAEKKAIEAVKALADVNRVTNSSRPSGRRDPVRR